MSQETDARIVIDDRLRQAGWEITDKSRVRTEEPVKIDGKTYFADYLLLDGRGRLRAVIEAKKKAIEPYTAKQQALPYASYVEVGTEGERVDKRVYITNWEETIREAIEDNSTLQKIRDGEFLTEDEEARLEQLLNQPRFYFNEENLRHAYNNTNSNLIDFIQAALGRVKIKSKQEQQLENFPAWLVSKSFTPEQAQYLILLKNRGIARGKMEIKDLFQPPLSVFNAAGLGIKLFGESGLRDIFDELNRSVFEQDLTEMDNG